jgi:plasmid stabilization system protein ParE
MRRLHLSKLFQSDLQDILIYIESYFGGVYTDSAWEKINHRMKTLAIFPDSGKRTRDSKFYYVNSHKNKIIYRFDSKNIYFERIIDLRKIKELLGLND